mgnify:FL=1
MPFDLLILAIAVVLAATFYSTAVNASIVAYGVKSISAAVIKLESLVSWLSFVGTVGSSVFKTKSLIGLNDASEVAKQL